MKGTTLLVVWQMPPILLPLHRKLALILAIPTAMLLLLPSNSPPGLQLLLFNAPAGETAVIPPLTATSPAATLPKTTNGKRMAPLPKALTVLPENASLSFDKFSFFFAEPRYLG